MEKRYIDLIHELEDSNTLRERAVTERNYMKTLKEAAVEQLDIARKERDVLREEVRLMNAAIENDAENRIRACDAVYEARADAERLREQAVNWIQFTETAQNCQGSLLVWREDAGTFVAFYDEEQECWFSERGEDLTGDLPAFYTRMPKGPNE